MCAFPVFTGAGSRIEHRKVHSEGPRRGEPGAPSSVPSAPPADVFAVLADHEHWPEWFPGIRRVTVLGPAEGVGARRRVGVGAFQVDEEFIAWEPGVRFAFTGVAATRRIARSLVEDCRLEPGPSGGTTITYSMYLDPLPLLRPLVKLASGRIAANNHRGLAALGERAARCTS